MELRQNNDTTSDQCSRNNPISKNNKRTADAHAVYSLHHRPQFDWSGLTRPDRIKTTRVTSLGIGGVTLHSPPDWRRQTIAGLPDCPSTCNPARAGSWSVGLIARAPTLRPCHCPCQLSPSATWPPCDSTPSCDVTGKQHT